METNQRLYSLDVFRGMTVAAMILVNNPGSWNHVYSPLLHAHWNGCTPTDLIFPFFLFIVGVSIHFGYQQKKEEGLTKNIILKIIKRSAIIFALGIFLSLFPKFNFEVVRIPGVLQRISIVFLVCSMVYLTTQWITQLRVGILLLLGYYLLMTFIPVPDFGPANLEPETNLGAWLDRLLFEGHLWVQSKTWDPEGLLSTTPAIATGILGMLIGQLISNVKEVSVRVTWMFFIGAMLIVTGLACDLIFPINKSLWTSSFVLYTGGIAIQFLAACHWIIDVQDYRKAFMPFVYYGTNALFVFVASGLLAKTLSRWKIIMADGQEVSAWTYLYLNGYESWLPPKIASLFLALTLLVLFFIILRWMYSRKMFVKI